MSENIKATSANFSLGPDSDQGFFYYVSDDFKQLVQVTTNAVIAATFIVTRSQLRGPIKELHYDGTFFWTLEDLPSDLGVVIKKWRLSPVPSAVFPNVTPTEFRWQDELTLINRPNIKYESSAFAIEHFHRTFQNAALQGANSIRLNSTSRLLVGETLHLGPSTFGGFTDVEEDIVVGGISGNEVFFSKSGGLEASYIGTDKADFTKAIWLFNDHSFSGTADNKGTVQRFAYPSKNRTLVDQGHKYSLVTAADFDSTILSFVRGGQIIDLDIDNPTFDLNSSLEANLFESDKKTSIEVFDLISDKDGAVYLKLQQKETSIDGSTTQDFSPLYNFQTISSIGFVNSTAIEFDNRFTLPFASSDTIAVQAHVRDQFNFPVSNETVSFSAAVTAGFIGIPGTFDPSFPQTTNSSGIVSVTYIPSTTVDEILMDIEAEVIPNEGVSHEVTAVVSQIGRFVQDSLTSNPIEQRGGTSNNNASSKPVEQIAPPDIPVDSTTSRPIEQRGPATFSPSSPPRLASIIEQKDVSTNDSSSNPIEQREFVTSSKPIEQKNIATNDGSSNPIEQQEIEEGASEIEQFDFIELIFPDCGSIKNPVDTNIRWRIRDFGSALDPETIVFEVDSIEVQDTSNFSITPITGGLELNFDPPSDFDFSALVTVFLSIQDVADPSNTFELLCTWTTVPDVRGPLFSDIGPACDSTDVDVLEPITFTVFDVGNGVDADTISLSVEGIIVCSGVTLDGFTTSSGSGVTVTYEHPEAPFRFGSEVTIALEASDLTDPPNSTLFICCFSVEESEGPQFIGFDPLQCETFVDNTTGLTFEVYGAADGVDISTLEVRIDNKLRKVFVRPRLLRDDDE